VVELTSDARRQADVVRGEADAERNRILAEAYGQDPEFFAFTRSLTAYEVSLQGGNSSIVMQPDSEFFDYLRSDAGRPSGASVGPTTAAPATETAPAEAAPAEPAAEGAPANP
jgi:membrane protease subunit HflC